MSKQGIAGSCMAALSATILAASAPALVGEARNACRFTERDFIGYWQDRASTRNDSRELQFAIEDGQRVFRSWMHQRPDMFGTWTFADCQMKVSGPGGMAMAYRFNATSKRRLFEVDGESTWRRLR